MKDEYEIVMTVPLGKRKGNMLLEEVNGIVKGKMTILGSTFDFQGTMEHQELNIQGIIKTSIRTIDYQGHGKISGDQIDMDLVDQKNIYKIKGRKKS